MIQASEYSAVVVRKRMEKHAVELHGVPKDMESVDALIHKRDDRASKEFEKWAILGHRR